MFKRTKKVTPVTLPVTLVTRPSAVWLRPEYSR